MLRKYIVTLNERQGERWQENEDKETEDTEDEGADLEADCGAGGCVGDLPGICRINRSYLQEGPLSRFFPLDYPSESTVGNDGSVYVIDQSKQRVSAFTQDGRYRYQIYGGSRSESAFYSAEDVKTDEAATCTWRIPCWL